IPWPLTRHRGYDPAMRQPPKSLRRESGGTRLMPTLAFADGIDGGRRSRFANALDGKPVAAAVPRCPVYGLPGRQADQRGTDRRQDRDFAFRNIRLARKDERNGTILTRIRREAEGRTHAHDVVGKPAIRDKARPVQFGKEL